MRRALGAPRSRTLFVRRTHSPRCPPMGLARAFIIAGALTTPGCTTRPEAPFWIAHQAYSLVLVASGPMHLTSDLAARLAPISDSATFRLRVDSIARDSVFGSYAGQTPHFWVMFRGIEDTAFVATRSGNRWRIALTPNAVDTGMDLSGVLGAPPFRGTWVVRDALGHQGTFEMRRMNGRRHR